MSIVKAGAVAPLVELLQSGNGNLRDSAVATISNLSASDANKAMIGASASIPLLVYILSDHAGTGSVQSKVDAVMALYNLSTLRQNLVSIITAGAVAPLTCLLKDCKKSSKLATKIMGLLESCMEFEEGRCSLIQQDGGLLAVVEILEEGTVQGREYAVGALLTMCQTDRLKYRVSILEEGAIPGLLELRVQGTQQSQRKAQELLSLLRDSPPSGKPVLMPCAMLKSVVSDIASHVDNTGAAKKMLTEIFHLNVEIDQGEKHIQRSGLVHVSTK